MNAFAGGPGFAPQPCASNGSTSGGTLTGGFVRYRGDDWDGTNILLFQYGTLVKGVGGAPDTVAPIDITGFVPVGALIAPARLAPCRTFEASPPVQPGLPIALTVAAGTARIVDALNGLFGFCPRSDITSRFAALSDAAGIGDANLVIAAKLIDTATPGNLGTIAKSPILVLRA